MENNRMAWLPCRRWNKYENICAWSDQLLQPATHKFEYNEFEYPSIQQDCLVFIARQHTHARYWYSKSVCPSVCLSVRNVPVSDENGLTYRHSFFFHHTVAQSFCFYQHQTSSRNSDGITPYEGAKYRWGIKISRFSTNKSLYLADDTR